MGSGASSVVDDSPKCMYCKEIIGSMVNLHVERIVCYDFFSGAQDIRRSYVCNSEECKEIYIKEKNGY